MTDQALKNRLTEDMKTAMRNKNKERLGTVRMILAAVKQVEVDERIEVSDERVLAILDKMAKQRRDAATQYRDAGREDLASQEEAELVIIQDFLPAALTDQELDAMIASAIEQTGAAGANDMGKVMGVLKPQVQGRADMGQVSKKVRDTLNG
ncbi:GatB/YqeY domain-containing protein [Hydrocarboniclastica marina]|uniref:GatB/YqeY domain-containing protein n=1 Tax=Hydrocarboniclastica marina TaxID=2259620 RepID=A0A4P7XGM0_9ALTE|nr:GatB/YqeY domain-containing protein [Hydrocarboniclastica marina]MAL99954.1 glutamyl-tRNA amidotransferase [Alteromonadaceae bacterium]QCF24907.1 GatB/YqeY domain-containing protein [Hydrocarboniclastica marina]|tara:strand:- start:2480 stop:2935 length:456 start_codon:yes stop_codon:yes gene_type:complete